MTCCALHDPECRRVKPQLASKRVGSRQPNMAAWLRRARIVAHRILMLSAANTRLSSSSLFSSLPLLLC